jgi:hypothetical protein
MTARECGDAVAVASDFSGRVCVAEGQTVFAAASVSEQTVLPTFRGLYSFEASAPFGFVAGRPPYRIAGA